MTADFERKLIEVCSECGQASCWHGEFMCTENKDAGTELKTVAELKKSGLENEYHWGDENLNKIYGELAPNGYLGKPDPKIINIDESCSGPAPEEFCEIDEIKKHRPKNGETSFQKFDGTDVYQWHWRKRSVYWKAVGPKFFISTDE